MFCGGTSVWRVALLSLGLVILQDQLIPSLCQDYPVELPDEGTFTLEGGQVEGTGNVLIYHEGRWGVVCDDAWDLNAAKVICKWLGFPYALGFTTKAYFGKPEYDMWLDDVQCRGDERTLQDCQTLGWGNHNCQRDEAAGVFCAPRSMAPPSTTSTTTTTTTTTTAPPLNTTITAIPTLATRPTRRRNKLRRRKKPRPEELQADVDVNPEVQENVVLRHTHNPPAYEVRILGGRNPTEGRVEVHIGGRWGVICSDRWTLLEGAVACRQAGLEYAKAASNYFGGDDLDKMLAGIRCDGDEERLSDCFHEQYGDVICPEEQLVAGVLCTSTLPDLVPNATLLEQSTYLQDRPLYYMECAMIENCASSSAYEIKRNFTDWHIQRRRLLRFSSSTWNFGTAEFRPFMDRQNWEWHNCHMHYHSMAEFAHYNLLDQHGNRVAEGHKASFCLEDVECLPGVEKQYACKGFAAQGISVGCADNYLHDIDCQWIDITDVKPGEYIFKVHVNPEYLVAEMNYNNNAVTCNLNYTGWQVYVTDCQLGRE